MSDVEPLERFLEHGRRRGLADTTLRKYEEIVGAFAGAVPLLEAETPDIERFLASRAIGPASRRAYLAHLHAFYAWAIDERLAGIDPTARIPRPRIPERLPRPLADEEVARALEHADPRMRAWVALGAYAGLRCKEIARLRADDLYRAPDVEPVLVVSSPKGRRERAVPIHELVEGALVAHGIPAAGYVFPHARGSAEPITPATVSYEIARYLRGLGIEGTAHRLRHYFGTRVYAVTRDLYVTQRLLGHASPATTGGYVQIAPNVAADAVRSL